MHNQSSSLTNTLCCAAACATLQEVYDTMRGNVSKGASAETQWKAAMEEYKAKYPAEYAEFTQLIR
jgi:transketolase